MMVPEIFEKSFQISFCTYSIPSISPSLRARSEHAIMESPPPGLGPPATEVAAMRTLSTGSAASSKAEGNDESEMAALLRAGDPNGALATLARAGSAANVRMANMQFNALLVIGHSVEAAIESVLATCTRGGFTPSQSICVNVLHALDKHSTPEAVLAWLARMREAGMQPDGEGDSGAPEDAPLSRCIERRNAALGRAST